MAKRFRNSNLNPNSESEVDIEITASYRNRKSTKTKNVFFKANESDVESEEKQPLDVDISNQYFKTDNFNLKKTNDGFLSEQTIPIARSLSNLNINCDIHETYDK